MSDIPEPALDCPYELTNEKTVFQGKWLITKQVDFKLRGTQNTGIWQSAHRPSRGNTLNADGVDIIATLKKDGKKYFILIKQYRIPIRRWILEFPAGLVDASDKSIEETGVRELKEETGYTVTRVIRHTTKGQFLNPGFSSDSSAFLLVEVDGNDPINQNPKQVLDTDENIEVILVECDKLLEYLDNVTKDGQVEVTSHVYSFALARLF
uniref:Nudix hydrolase domain-containing protein n=1 Tax=Panagrolaimus davidi TaxID=227884 RepID=A0A914NZZ5_9BILA